MTLTPEDYRKKQNARGRARRSSKKLTEALAVLYKPVEEWDIDELAHGRPRAIDGTWKGMAPKWVTPAVRDEAKRRFQTLGRSMLNDHLVSAVKVVSDLATCEDVDEYEKPVVPASVRLSAATYLIDQILGKATSKVEVEAGESLRDVLATSLVLPDGAEATVIQPGVDYEEDDDGE